MVEFSKNDRQRLHEERNLWFVSVKPNNKPHMVPLWFVFVTEKIYVCTTGNSVKVQNLETNASVVIALEDGFHAFICEGHANLMVQPFKQEIVDAFIEKYDWNIKGNKSYNVVIEIIPNKLMKFNDER